MGPDGWDYARFKSMGFRQRVHLISSAWAVQGNNLPLVAVLFYLAKTALFLYSFLVLCVNRAQEESETRTLIRFLVYSSMWESFGMGCGSGPSTGKFLPPVLTSFFHFVYMGTPKIPAMKRLGTRRGILDVVLFSLYLNYSCKLAFSTAAEINVNELQVWLVVYVCLAICDQVFFLASRGEIMGSMMVATGLVLLSSSPDDDVQVKRAIRSIQLLVWFWAGVSKHGEWWCYVMPVMTACNPFLKPLPHSIKLAMFKDWPRSLEPSVLARRVALMGFAAEFFFPACLAVGGPVAGWIGFSLAVGFHLFILAQIPMGAPLEWNVFTIVLTVYAFTSSTNVFTSCRDIVVMGDQRWSVEQAKLIGGLEFPGLVLPTSFTVCAYILIAHVVLPLYGNLHPERISFLLAHRYYAGNWPTTCWLVKRSALGKLKRIWAFSSLPHDQLACLYLEESLEQLEYRALCGRMMHLNSRALLKLLPLAVDAEEDSAEKLDEYLIIEGELFAGTTLGWCFGDGHLCGEALLREIQSRCDFQAEELKHISIEPFPLFGNELTWAIRNEQCQILQAGKFTSKQLASWHL